MTLAEDEQDPSMRALVGRWTKEPGLSFGLEAKELRSALESLLPAQNSIISWSRGGGKTTVLKAFDKLNIPKSSYEQEVALMENVISTWKNLDCEGYVDHKYKIWIDASDAGGGPQVVEKFLSAVEALDKFREERRTP